MGPGILALALVQAMVSVSWYCTLVASVHRAHAILARRAVRQLLTAVSAGGLLTLAIALLFSSTH